MSRYAVVAVAMCAVVLAGSTAFAAPTVDELFKMIADKQGTIKTMQGDLAMKMNMPEGGGVMNGTGRITTATAEVDGKTVTKMHQIVKSTMDAGGMSMNMDMKMVNDGRFLWMERRMSGMPMAMPVQVTKAKPGQGQTVGESVEEMKKNFDFTGTGEESIDGKKMYTLEGKPKAGAAKSDMGGEIKKVKYYFDQSTLVMRRMVMFGADGKEFNRFDLTNVKLNEAVDMKLFEYTPPAGAVVRDMTNR